MLRAGGRCRPRRLLARRRRRRRYRSLCPTSSRFLGTRSWSVRRSRCWRAVVPRGKHSLRRVGSRCCASRVGQPTPTARCGPPRRHTASACRPPPRPAGGSPRRRRRAAAPIRIVAGAGRHPRPSRRRRPSGPYLDRVSTPRTAMVTEPRRTAEPLSPRHLRVPRAVDASGTVSWSSASGRLDFLNNDSRHS